MADIENQTAGPPHQPEGNPPKPLNIAEPTYWPLVLAVGITTFAWGWVTSWLMTLLGLILVITSVVNWIGDMRHDRGYEQETD